MHHFSSVLLIDNGDSFTHLLASQIFEAIGQWPCVLMGTDEWNERSRRLFEEADAIVIGPGPGTAADAPPLARRAVESNKPVVGVCLGHQLIALAAGATVERAQYPLHGLTSQITHSGTGLFEGVPNPMTAMRYHSLDVTAAPDSLEVLARAEDGTVMALRHRHRPQWGVQFHPESAGTPDGLRVLRNALLAALAPLRWADLARQRGGYFAWLEFNDTTTLAYGGPASAVSVHDLNELAATGTCLVGGMQYEATGGIDGGEWDNSATMWFRPERLLRFPGRLDVSPGERGRRQADIQLRHSREEYRELVHQCQEAIARGDAYELCLTTKATVELDTDDPLEAYRRLRAVAPAPMNGLLIGPGTAVLSASPETFLTVRDSQVQAWPMKGTRPRGTTPEEDARLRAELAESRKDRAENMMIVDVLRNDLTRSCTLGSVRVREMCTTVQFQHWHQMISIIEGERGAGPVETLRLAFPGGSMTGAPKQRSMELLESFEGAPRGWYSGALGVISEADATFAMLIRTGVLTGTTLTYGVGGAITLLSDADEEYDEVLAKLAALKAL